MNLQDLQDKLQVLYDNDTSTPDSGDEDFDTRTILFNSGLGVWETEEQWRELLVSSDSLTVPITTTAGISSYDLPDDFARIVGYLRTSDGTTYNYIPQKDLTSNQFYSNDGSTPYFYISGNPADGYKINIHPTPGTSGLTLVFEYYKHPTDYQDPADISEIPDPMFLVYYALSKLFDADGASLKSQKAYMEMSSRLENMVKNNMLLGWGQSSEIPDVDFQNGVGGFGW